MGGMVQSMSYDPDGVRIGKTMQGETVDYLTDTNRDYAQVLYESTPSTELHYTFGLDLVGLDTGSERYTYHSDALGSTRLLTDSAGDTVDEIRYDAWGEQLSGGDVAQNQYLYTGEQFDVGLGKTYLRARYLDSGLGRFSQMDAWMGKSGAPKTLNKYLYADAESPNLSDPSGRFSIGSLMKALNVASSMYTVTEASVGVFNSVSAGDSANVGDIGLALITSKMAGGGKLVKHLAQKICGKNNCKFPILDYRHIFYGEIKKRKAKGFHSTAIVSNTALTGSAYVDSEIWRKATGIYKAWVSIPDPRNNRYRKKRSTMFPDTWRPSLVGGSLYLAWMKNRGRNSGTLSLGFTKIQYYVRDGLLHGFPIQ